MNKSATPMRFLKHIETGQVLAWTEILAAHKQMRPYDPQEAVNAEVPNTEKPSEPAIMDKDEASVLVHKLFGRDHTRVTLAELAEYAKTELGVEIEPDKKLKMVAEIAAILKARE